MSHGFEAFVCVSENTQEGLAGRSGVLWNTQIYSLVLSLGLCDFDNWQLFCEVTCYVGKSALPAFPPLVMSCRYVSCTSF